MLASLVASLVQPVISSVVKGISGRGVNSAKRIYRVYVINLDDKISKKLIGFHYLLTEMQLYTFIPLKLNIRSIKSIKQNVLDYSKLFSLKDYKKTKKITYKYFKDKYDRKSNSRV